MNPPADIQIRTATEADIPQLLELADRLVEYDRQFDPSLDPLYNRSADGLAWLRAALADPAALVLVAAGSAAGNAAGSVVGMLFGRLEDAEPWRDTGGLLAELEMLCVAPAVRSAGIGKRLTDAFAAWARERGATRAWVRVSAGNIAAIRFYQRELFADYDVILERPL
jgi:ribosomal protein S18 acetylase RimI-like enzyme